MTKRRPIQDAAARWLPVALVGLGLASGAFAQGKARAREVHEELGARIRAGQVRLETFCPETWWEVEAAYDRLGRKLRDAKLFFQEYDLFEPWRIEAEAACEEKARLRANESVSRLRQRMRILREAQSRSALTNSPKVSRLMDEASIVLDETATLLAEKRYVELKRRSTDVFDHLDAEVADPCQEKMRRAAHADAMGHVEQAAEYLSGLDPNRCLDMKEARWLKQKVERRLAEKDAVPELPPRSAPPSPPPRPAPEPPPPKTRPLKPAPQEKRPVESRPSNPAYPVSTHREEPHPIDEFEVRADGRVPIALTVWQSAWGDFSEIDRLGEFARRNGIREIYLNPGLGITRDTYPQALKRMGPLVAKLRRHGIDRIGFLYAELRYKVAEYARFLKMHPELGIRTLVDDSEFTDLFKDRFERNSRAVRQHGLEYAAFVTLEKVGNSGVSDETRYWALEHLDQTMLMSYFGCSFEEQKQWLEPYLSFADRRGRPRSVSVTLLMGSKKVGREVSCERQLGEREFHRLVRDLHAWASRFRSYRGIVLENNRPLPRYDVAPMTGAP